MITFPVPYLCILCGLQNHLGDFMKIHFTLFLRTRYLFAGISQIKSLATIIPEKIIVLKHSALAWQYQRDSWNLDSNSV